MMTSESRHGLIVICTGVILLVLDLITKFAVQNSFSLGESIPVWGEFIKFTYVLNPKGAFGISVGSNTVHIVISLMVAAAVIYVLVKGFGQNKLTDYALAGIISGAVGNLVDRIRLGKVVDFMDVNIPDIEFMSIHLRRWPVFNVADAAVTIGILLVLIVLIFGKQEKTSCSIPGTNSR